MGSVPLSVKPVQVLAPLGTIPVMKYLRWQPYDPSWLVTLAREQHPDEPWLADALARCTRGIWGSRAQLYFVSPEHPNRPGSDWQFVTNIMLESRKEGTLILDILTEQRVGSVEFLRRI